jgi:predicted CXXCH cytochrome family protein
MPHNASNVGAPLWNRTNQTNAFQMYSKDNSATFVLDATDTNASNRKVGPVSLACLSCHDGATAFNSLNQGPMIDTDNNIQPTAYTFTSGGAAVVNMAQASAPGPSSADLGTDLTNDHPISFTYDAALATLKGTTLRDPGVATGDGTVGNTLVIFRAGGASGGASDTIASQMLFTLPPTATSGAVANQLECASCHEPHMQGDLASATSNYPFLIKSNYKSNLCLTCHNK